jgi:eukaryotic-like serine/threonine-protein kinase
MTPPSSVQSGRVRFGAFELDLRSGELWRIGPEESGKVVLQEQPFRILQMLLELKGGVATRDEIKRSLWPDDRTVDFNHSINVTIAALRRVLGDSADEPQYIETVARRGYRLIPAAEWPTPATETTPVAESDGDERRMETSESTPAKVDTTLAQTGHRSWNWLGVLTLLAAVSIGSVALWRWRIFPRLSANDTVVLADITNQTSDSVFDDALNTALRVEFEQTPFLNILAPDKVRGAMKLLNFADDARVTPEAARDVCRRTHSRAVIASSIADAGNRFRLELQTTDCQTGKVIASVKRDVASRNEIVHVAGSMGEDLRRKMGEPKASVSEFGKPLEVATSSSLEALQLLTAGFRRHMARDPQAASYYQRAIGLDPKLALAYTALGALYSNFGRETEASAAETKAYELRDRLTGPTRFLAETLYYDVVTGDFEKSVPVYKEWTGTFPLDIRSHINFGFCLITLGRYKEASDEAREAMRLLPSSATYGNFMQAAIYAGQIEEAKAAYNEAASQGIDVVPLRDWRSFVAFVQRDKPAMEEQLAWANGKSGGAVAPIYFGESNAQAYFGHFQSARQWLDRAETEAKASFNGKAVSNIRNFAMQEVEAGQIVDARTLSESAPAGPDRDARAELAWFFARTGNVEKATKLADSLRHEFPLDTLLQNYTLPSIRAAIQLQQKDPAGAIESLQPAAKYELAAAEPFNSVYPAYLRGVAYLELGDGVHATPEFQKLLDHPGIVGRYVTGALARLQLARAQAMAGDKVGARKSYQDFLSLWKDADREIPIYREAQLEYSKLN